MSADPNLKSTLREIDPNVLQRRAAAPGASVWVGASAGTGKTKVLTDRVLRLLLPRGDKEPGTAAHKILCLTFTKTAASEMALRIHQTLARWAVLPPQNLDEALNKLLGRAAYSYERDAAQQLFAQVIDSGAGLQIMTIHSFCQSVLGRFPLEAGLLPYFNVLEESDAQKLQHQARDHILKAKRDADEPLAMALQQLTQWLNEEQLTLLLADILRERRQLQNIMNQSFEGKSLHEQLCVRLDISPMQTQEALAEEFCAAIDKKILRDAVRVLSKSKGKTDQARGDILARCLEHPAPDLELYKTAFLTAKDEPFKTPASKAICEEAPDVTAWMEAEAARLMVYIEQKRSILCARLTADLLDVGQSVHDTYTQLKNKKGALDFDDLILKTAALLSEKSMAGWVQFKLDQGLDHILIDEAQDTNPEQWDIAGALAEEFFAGIGARDDVPRSVFVVGDEKQSIYSFQRAAPDAFDEMRTAFSERVRQAKQKWDEVALNISFRSTAAVLELVDTSMKSTDNPHISYRTGQGGTAVLWPVFESDEAAASDLWEPPIQVEEHQSGASKMATHVASTIRRWLDEDEILESHGQPITPGDIMILVRTRNAFTEQLTRALKLQNIPLAGHDRMILNEQLVIEDVLALAQFALLPGDDYTLACLLKSPLIGLDEEALFDLCYGRTESLWGRVQEVYPEIADYLQNWIRQAQTSRIYEFFNLILHRPCPADSVSGFRALQKRLGSDIADPIEEFLALALQFESSHLGTLQHFIQHQQAERHVIKREMEAGKGAVRIMTVHGAKGLQAPIVILPDTMRTTRTSGAKADERLLWPHQSGLDMPLYAPRSAEEPDLYREAKAHYHGLGDAEYRRLLYVAMTRAEERLYVGGYIGGRQPIEESWYYDVQRGFARLKNSDYYHEDEDGSLIYHRPRVKEPDKAAPDKHQKQEKTRSLPDWVFQKAAPEAGTPDIVVPSRLSDDETAMPASKPFDAANPHRFLRGNLTHKLLELLPDMAPERQEEAAFYYVERYAQDLGQKIHDEIVREVMHLINHPQFHPIFGPNSRAEVPLTGLMGTNQILSGQIDRLLITDKEIFIIDYKTNRPPPQEPADIPQIYLNQMAGYKAALTQIYPGRAIKCALLWTDGPHLMEIPTNMLELPKSFTPAKTGTA